MREGLHFHGVWRMDWGFGNPNITAAVIAMLMIAVWGLAYIHRWGFWAALMLFTPLAVCLGHTMSRGGLVAFLAGACILVYAAPRPWAQSRVIAVGLAMLVVAGASLHLRTHQRFGNGLVQEDRSITNRLVIWKDVPRMMLDAPGGWGWKQAATAYMQWYQDVDRPERYRNLVNSHFTWLVEMNWPLRIGYVLAWCGVILLSFPTGTTPCLSIACGVWMAFAAAAFFTHIGEFVYVWIIPAISLLAILALRWNTRTWPSFRQWSISGVAGLVLLAAFISVAFVSRHSTVQKSSRGVTIGAGMPKVWLVANPTVVGGGYGKTIRRYMMAHSIKDPIGIVESATALSGGPGVTVAVGAALSPADLLHLNRLIGVGTRVIVLNPAFFPQELSNIAHAPRHAEAVFGEFSQSPAVAAWSGVATVRQLEGVGDFLPSWPELLFTSAR